MIDFHFYAITDRSKCADVSLIEHLEKACAGGLRAVQLREKDLEARQVFELARQARKITGHYGTKLFINDRVDIAMAVNADGVHCRESSMRPAAIKTLDDELEVGASVHSAKRAREAEQEGADFLVFGPVFKTPSKPDNEPKELHGLEEVCRAVEIPVFALGGIRLDNANACYQHGAAGVAGISIWMEARDLSNRLKELGAQLPDL